MSVIDVNDKPCMDIIHRVIFKHVPSPSDLDLYFTVKRLFHNSVRFFCSFKKIFFCWGMFDSTPAGVTLPYILHSGFRCVSFMS